MSEVFVDANGVAHDDEGNTWIVGRGFPTGTYRPREVPYPSGSRSREGMWRDRRSIRGSDVADKVTALKLAISKRPSTFLSSILGQLESRGSLSFKQMDAVRKILVQLRLNDQAKLFESERLGEFLSRLEG